MTDTQNTQGLIQSAEQDGLSAASVGIMINNLNPVVLAGAQGVGIDDLAGDDVTLFVRVIDASGSMGRFQPTVIAAANEQLDALLASKAGDGILMSTYFFNTTSNLLHSYLALDKATRLDGGNYLPGGQTALYDTTLDAITAAVSYAQDLRNAGIRVQIVVVVVTDGEDNASRHSVNELKTVIQDLIRQEIYTFAFVAFGTEGKRIAGAMGIPPENVIDEQADAHSIRLAFGTVSKSVISTSQHMISSGSQSFF